MRLSMKFSKTLLLCIASAAIGYYASRTGESFVDSFSWQPRIISQNQDCERPNYYQFGLSAELTNFPDADNDKMNDFWEDRNGLDGTNGLDYQMDSDNDGFTNLEEFEADTDPQYSRSYPGVIAVTRYGFDCFYDVKIGLINDDDLVDVFIGDPSPGYLPAIRDFVLIQDTENGFTLQDASSYTISDMAPIQSSVVLAELNGDDNIDLVLTGLSEKIPEAYDQIIFSPVCELCWYGRDIPSQHVQINPDLVSFFQDLDQWILSHNGSYFDMGAGDSSPFNPDALYLAQNSLKRIRGAGVMFYPSADADEIYEMIAKYLGSPVFYYSHLSGSLGIYPRRSGFEHIRSRETIGSIQRVLKFISDRFIRERID